MPCSADWEPGIQTSYPAFSGNLETDVVIVGGGLTGMTCALALTSMGKQVVLLEKDVLGCGASQGCTGKLTAHQPQIYAAIHAAAGSRAAQTYARLMQDCVQDVRALIERLGIACGQCDASMACYTMDPRGLPALRRLAALEDSLGLPVGVTANHVPHARTDQAVSLGGQLLMEPLPYLAGMARCAVTQGCRIFEHSPVTQLGERRVSTASGTVRAAWVVLATGYPLLLRPSTPMLLMQQHVLEARSLRTILSPAGGWVDTAPVGVNLRPIPGGVLLSADLGPSGHAHRRQAQLVSERCARLYPAARESQQLHRQDVWSLDGLPLIGPVHPAAPRLLMASGYSGWGLTGSMLAGRLLTARIIGQSMAEAPLFLPHRQYPRHWLQLLRGGFRLGAAMVGSLLHTGAPVCPHMGCRLVRNSATGLWECPCHGSSYDADGCVLRAPSAENTRLPRV